MRAFAADSDLSREEMLEAPVRWPNPAAWTAPLEVPGTKKAQAAAEQLGLDTVGALLEHLPRGRQTARTVAALVPGETASVIVEVRSIRSRRFTRSAITPPIKAKTSMGAEEAKPTNPSQKAPLVWKPPRTSCDGILSASSSTNQPWATFCIQVPTLERKFPAQNREKSRLRTARSRRGIWMAVEAI